MSAPPNVGHAPGASTLREVTLATDSSSLPDLLTSWIDQFNTASQNATQLLNTFAEAPLVGTQQLIANMSGWAQDLLNDPANSNAVAQQMQSDLNIVLTGYGLQNADNLTTNIVLQHTLDSGAGFGDGHFTLFQNISGYIPAGEQAAAIPIINFLASPASGIIMGMLGPEISPWVALFNSVSAGDGFNETLANTIGAYFNGATLNLDSLLPTINGLDLFPKGMAMAGLDIGFGGLLSTGSVGNTPVLGEGGVGGSIFNSVGLHFTGVPVLGTIDAPSQPVGPLGAWEGWSQIIATLLGWSGSGSPLADVTLPTVPVDLSDGGAADATAVTDLSTLVQDLWSGLGL